MKITSQEEYGLRCLLRLAGAEEGHSLTIPEIAAAENGFVHSAEFPRLRNIIAIKGDSPPSLLLWDEMVARGRAVSDAELTACSEKLNAGQPINIQLLGRAWDDDKLVGMAYAFEEIANAAGHGHVEATSAPPLK